MDVNAPIIPAEMKDSTPGETFLDKEFLVLFLKLPAPVKFTMLELFINQGWRAMLTARKLAIQDDLINKDIDIDDPAIFTQRFKNKRIELGFVEDILRFMDEGLESLRQDFPEAFQNTQSPQGGN